MHHPDRYQTLWLRCLVVLLIPALALTVVTCLVCRSVAQNPPSKKPKPEEVEDSRSKTAPKTTLRVPNGAVPNTRKNDRGASKQRDEELDQPSYSGPAALAQAARKTKDPAAKELYLALTHPHDDIITGAIARRMSPVTTYIGDPPSFKGTLDLTPFDDQWKRMKPKAWSARELSGFEPYEQIAIERVNQYLKDVQTRDPDTDEPKLTLKQLDVAVKVIDAVLQWHRSWREHRASADQGWKQHGENLRHKLLDLLLQQLAIYMEHKNWDRALTLLTRLNEDDEYGTDTRVRNAFAQLLGMQAMDAVQAAQKSDRFDDWQFAAERLAILRGRFPHDPKVETVGGMLKDKAVSLKAQGDAALAQHDNPKAVALFRKADSLWPQLRDLHQAMLRLSDQYPILYVGVPHLPVHLSPATARTDSERQVVNLIFESLIQPTYSNERGQSYVPQLALRQPRMIPLGRAFSLHHDVYWSDGKLLSGSDVRHTAQLLMDSGRADLLGRVQLRGTTNYEVELTLKQGYIDPLALMSFKVVPYWLKRLDDPAFALKPVGSGPYMFKSRSASDVVLIANPLYGKRRGKPGLPHIQEIHFFESGDHRADFLDQPNGGSHKMDLLLGLSTKDVRELSSLEPNVHVQSLRNRRIYFLAVNHRQPVLRNQALRQVIAGAIDREAILNGVFRDPNAVQKAHRALTGPYPPGSWAYVQQSPFNRDAALAKAGNLPDLPITLRLYLPDGDPDSADACARIAEAMPKGIKLNLISLPEDELRRRVETLHDYDIAYYHYDFPSESYSLWPLLNPDPRALDENGGNYLGYTNDEKITPLLQQLNSSRRMSELTRLAHDVCGQFAEQLPFIPLWQLDTFYARHQDLTMPAIGPLHLFIDVEDWTLQKH